MLFKFRMIRFLRKLLTSLGEDCDREGLRETPRRFLKSFEEVTRGYSMDPNQFFRNALFDVDYEEMIWVQKIPFYSLCEHHLLPFFGHCTIAYLPQGKVIGLSKIHKVVEMFACRLQLQERLTQQIAQEIQKLCGARGVGVFIQSKHLCMAMRGVRNQNSEVETYTLVGEIENKESFRKEFFNGVQHSKGVDSGPQAKLELKSLQIPVSLGVFPKEKQEKQVIKIDLKLKFSSLPEACTNDQLSDTVCYDQLSRQLIALCGQKHFELIEHLGYALYCEVKKNIPKGMQAQIRVSKALSEAQQGCFVVGDF